MQDDRTIYAPASAPGKAGVAVFRVSGREALRAVKDLCVPAYKPEPRVASLRKIKNPRTGDIIDEGLAVYFQTPHSFTGEDVVEFFTHGGRAVTSAMLEALAALPDFRLAEPGEFTRRGFENGRMDLTEAEAVADLIDAETEAQRRQAIRQLKGALGKLYEDWRDRLSRGLAMMEAAIDFSEEELPEDLIEKQTGALRGLREEIASHLNDDRRGERLRDGFSLVLLGAPNAGKSSLLNALAQRDVAIVSPFAGTTRDVIDVHLDVAGYPVVLSDTAGLREPSASEGSSAHQAIEGEGIRRAQSRAREADLKLVVLDGVFWPAREASVANLIDENAIVVVNKCDLMDKERIARAVDEGQAPVFLSALTGEGIDALLTTLGREIDRRFSSAGTPSLTRARHREALKECVDCLDRALQAVQADLRAEDVRLAMRALGRITGRVDVEDLLDIIFRDFCIGK